MSQEGAVVVVQECGVGRVLKTSGLPFICYLAYDVVLRQTGTYSSRHTLCLVRAGHSRWYCRAAPQPGVWRDLIGSKVMLEMSRGWRLELELEVAGAGEGVWRRSREAEDTWTYLEVPRRNKGLEVLVVLTEYQVLIVRDGWR